MKTRTPIDELLMFDPLLQRYVPFVSKDYDASELIAEIQVHIDDSVRLYKDLIKAGVMKQQAITVLPFCVAAPNLPIQIYDLIYQEFLESE